MRKPNRHIKCLKVFTVLLLCCLCAAPVAASTATASSFLRFSPTDQLVQPGDSVSVDIFFSNPNGTRVGAYDLNINYDPNILAFDTSNVMFGQGLGGDSNPFQNVMEEDIGRVNVFEFTTLSDLSDLQDGTSDLLLFSMTFDAISLGDSMVTSSSGIDPDDGFLGDEEGFFITLDRVEDGTINVVPIPGAIWLMTFGLASLFGVRHRSRKRTSD